MQAGNLLTRHGIQKFQNLNTLILPFSHLCFTFMYRKIKIFLCKKTYDICESLL